MKIASIRGRALILTQAGHIDIHHASQGRFPSASDDLIPLLPEVKAWYETEQPAVTNSGSIAALESNLSQLDPPLMRPRQIFAIGLNYKSHAEEVDMAVPNSPMVFTKFPSSITGPGDPIPLPPGTVDWEVELVAVIGKGGRNISRNQAMDHICAYTIGQDVSERTLQMADSPPQFSLAKSHQGFAPIGPWLTTADEITNPQDLAIQCNLDGEVLQSARTSMMIFDIATQVTHLSSVCELFPGDLIFTGTPDGVGMSRTPPRFLEAGKTLSSSIEGLGAMRNPCV
jgi:2-keto-4-pentenoate hydratase/2-oxohepta-3-ene-1,7-dioic acid hydratase in catechol pathway